MNLNIICSRCKKQTFLGLEIEYVHTSIGVQHRSEIFYVVLALKFMNLLPCVLIAAYPVCSWINSGIQIKPTRPSPCSRNVLKVFKKSSLSIQEEFLKCSRKFQDQ